MDRDGYARCLPNPAIRKFMSDWLDEHIRKLAQLSGISPAEAKHFFYQPLTITLDPTIRHTPTYRLAFIYAVNLLTRLFPATQFDDLDDKSLLILPWGGGAPLT